MIFMIINIILLTVPISPFFFLNSLDIDSTPKIEGPYISRDASGEALEVLQQIENLSLKDVVGLDPTLSNTTFLICNDTLNYIIAQIPTEEILKTVAIKREAYIPRNYFFNWSVCVEENDTLSIKPTEIIQYCTKVSSSDSPLIFTWWINDIQLWDNFKNISQSSFANYSLNLAWVFYGAFSYSTICYGCIDSEIIEAEQLILLDSDLKFLCFIYDIYI
jgi:hypothetical protein